VSKDYQCTTKRKKQLLLSIKLAKCLCVATGDFLDGQFRVKTEFDVLKLLSNGILGSSSTQFSHKVPN
jgi:hypothetical protein